MSFEAHSFWSANDGQCLAAGCPFPREFADPYCAQHRALINASGRIPASKPECLTGDKAGNK